MSPFISPQDPERHRAGHALGARLTAMLAGLGIAMALAVPASAVPTRPPTIDASQAAFTIPVSNSADWRLRLWAQGVLEGTEIASFGRLSVPVPVTTQSAFQVDVSVAARPGAPFYFYSGTRASVPGCGLTSSIAGDIYLCSPNSTQTTTEVPAGILAANGPQWSRRGPTRCLRPRFPPGATR